MKITKMLMAAVAGLTAMGQACGEALPQARAQVAAFMRSRRTGPIPRGDGYGNQSTAVPYESHGEGMQAKLARRRERQARRDFGVIEARETLALGRPLLRRAVNYAKTQYLYEHVGG